MHVATRLFVVAACLGAAAPALAQDATTGAIRGVVTDGTKEPLIGATIVVKGPRIPAQTAITDDRGRYRFTQLPPGGDYTITAYWADLTWEIGDITIEVDSTLPVYIKMTGEIVVVDGHPPPLNTTSTAKENRLPRRVLLNTPMGLDSDGAISSTAGSQSDGVGTMLSGSSSNENQYYLNGVATTGLSYGTSGTAVLNDFIEDIQVVSGGYNAEYGRSTGGIVNVVTRSGSNELGGSVFGYVTPGALVAGRERTPSQATSIDARTDLEDELTLGAEVGGPIVKDRAWFWIGFSPQQTRTITHRVTRRRTDCRVQLDDGTLSTAPDQPCSHDDVMAHQDGHADVDPATGFYIYEDLDSQDLTSRSRSAQVLANLSLALSPEHQGQLSLLAQPGASDGQRSYGFLAEQQLETRTLTTDASLKWTSKLFDNRTELEAVLGSHRDHVSSGSAGGARDGIPLQVLYFGNLGTWANLGGGTAESAPTRRGCGDNTGADPYALITNCPDEGVGYAVGGPGSIANDTEQRLSARLAGTERWRGHEIKGGVDAEDDRIDHARIFSGDTYFENMLDRSEIRAHRWVKLGDGLGDVCRDRATDRELACDFLGASDPSAQVEGETLNWSAYLRDSWQLRPDLTINAGLRYEEQRLRYARDLRHTTDPLTGRRLGSDAMALQNLWAPRLGIMYDPTREGRSKIYGHWGRFYESIPLDINDRSFGGEVQYEQRFDAGTQCGDAVDGFGGPDGNGCLVEPGQRADKDEIIFGSGVLVEPDIKPQYMDELLIGAEYELVEDLVIGISFQDRRLGRVIEDVSLDGGQTYVIANPGELSGAAERELQAQIDGATDAAERSRLTSELEQYQGIRDFDAPRRDYDALQFTAARRFSKQMYFQGSYTYARTRGNYPGLVSYDNGQLDPNISSQYDLIELLANRDGALPQDRPHYVKLDGYYTFDLHRAGSATVGARFRALSGTPINVLGAHYKYGAGESFLLPRGRFGRTDFETGFDLHVGYERPLRHGMSLSVFADVFNVLDRQGTLSVDEDYTYVSNVNPIVGGTYDDLVFAKEVGSGGNETSAPVLRNPNFGHVNARYAPASARFGLRLTF
jgi:outer membrane receptor protein involved in Fe transport